MGNAISVTILTKNSQKHLFACLSALQDFDEIIVLDNGSTDNTFAIAAQFRNVKVFKSPFIGFGPLKNLAAQHASNAWILSIDSDEVVTEELRQELLQLDLSNPAVAYSIKRHNYYRNKLIKACGWDNDYVLRVYNKETTCFEELQVHEYVRTKGLEVLRLSGTIDHYSYDSVSQLIQKSDKYTSLFAAENRFRKKSSPFKSYYKWAFSFFRNYMLQRGFLYGYEGLTISFANAGSSFYKYIKLHEANQALDISLVVATGAKDTAWPALKSQLNTQSEAAEEVLVIGSAPLATEKAVKVQNKFVPVRYLSQPESTLNLQELLDTLSQASGEYIVVADGADILSADFLKIHKKHARKGAYLRLTANANQVSLAFWMADLTGTDVNTLQPAPYATLSEALEAMLIQKGITRTQTVIS